jgi:hypothetical protein
MVMKICSKCQLPKELTEFNKRSNSKDGLRYECKSCQKLIYEQKREYYIIKMKNNRIKHIDEYAKRDREYYETNRNGILYQKKEYYKENRNEILIKKKEYDKENSEHKKEYNKNYRKNNKPKLMKYARDYSKEWRKTHSHIVAWRRVLSCSLKRLNKSKEGHTIDLLGYSPHQLKEHLESLFTDGMSWDNYGEWHIDHKIPVCSFSADTPPSVVNALSNLQPLWATTREINGIIYEGNLNKWKYD